MAGAEEINNHLPFVMSSLNKMRLDGFICDFEVKVEELTLKTHRLILAANSGFFKDIFAKDGEQETVISMTNIEPSVMKQCIEYMYSSYIDLELKYLSKIFEAAKFFKMPHLTQRICNFLKKELTPENSIYIQNLARNFGLPDVEKAADDVIMNHLGIVTSTINFPYIKIKDLLRYISKANYDVTWLAIAAWCKGRETYFPLLVERVDFSKFPFDFLLKIILNEPLLRMSENATLNAISALCETSKLEEHLNITNCFFLNQIAGDLNSKNFIMSFMEKNFISVVSRPGFLSLSASDVVVLMRAFDAKPEELKWESLISWIKHNLPHRQKLFPKLFQLIRLQQLPLQYLNFQIRREQLVAEDSTCLAILTDAIFEITKRLSSDNHELASSKEDLTQKLQEKERLYEEVLEVQNRMAERADFTVQTNLEPEHHEKPGPSSVAEETTENIASGGEGTSDSSTQSATSETDSTPQQSDTTQDDSSGDQDGPGAGSTDGNASQPEPGSQQVDQDVTTNPESNGSEDTPGPSTDNEATNPMKARQESVSGKPKSNDSSPNAGGDSQGSKPEAKTLQQEKQESLMGEQDSKNPQSTSNTAKVVPVNSQSQQDSTEKLDGTTGTEPAGNETTDNSDTSLSGSSSQDVMKNSQQTSTIPDRPRQQSSGNGINGASSSNPTTKASSDQTPGGQNQHSQHINPEKGAASTLANSHVAGSPIQIKQKGYHGQDVSVSCSSTAVPGAHTPTNSKPPCGGNQQVKSSMDTPTTSSNIPVADSQIQSRQQEEQKKNLAPASSSTAVLGAHTTTDSKQSDEDQIQRSQQANSSQLSNTSPSSGQRGGPTATFTFGQRINFNGPIFGSNTTLSPATSLSLTRPLQESNHTGGFNFGGMFGSTNLTQQGTSHADASNDENQKDLSANGK